MEDPRIDELMEFLDSVDEDGQPTSIALIARRVSSYMEIISKLREELDEYHSSVEDLEIRRDNLAKRMDERKSLREDITQNAQDAAAKAAFSTTSRGALLRKEAAEKRRELKQFEGDYVDDEKRFREVTKALDNGKSRLMDIRDQIARRMNIIDALLQRAEIEWPSYFFEENDRLKAAKGLEGELARPGQRRRGRRRVVRRRRAS